MSAYPAPSVRPVAPTRPAGSEPAGGHAELVSRFHAARANTVRLAQPLSPEDCQVQSMPDASSVKWHLAHVTWFLETVILEPFEPDFAPWNAAFRVLFNSYYIEVGDRFPRNQRGLLTRPGLEEVLAWRRDVDARIARLLSGSASAELVWLVELGIQHEQQHQELLLTDVKHLLSCNPLRPAYREPSVRSAVPAAPVAQHRFCAGESGLVEMGIAPGTRSFHFDNEAPRHPVFLQPYALGSRLITNGEWLEFIDDGGYQQPRWWLDAGWVWRTEGAIDAPLYWQHRDTAGRADAPRGLTISDWQEFTLDGCVVLDAACPVTHISFFEADAFARWKAASFEAFRGARLPTEFEWEAFAARVAVPAARHANFQGSGRLHPSPAEARSLIEPASSSQSASGIATASAAESASGGIAQLFGDAWEWTSSSYSPYPGYQPWSGTVGEYNGKFMINQMVLRGGSCATPASHFRLSYRNFFVPSARWQFTGLRLARSLAE